MVKDLRNDELAKIKEDFLSCFAMDENIASLRDDKNSILKELASYLGLKKTLIGKTYRYWAKSRVGEDSELDEIRDFLDRLEVLENGG